MQSPAPHAYNSLKLREAIVQTLAPLGLNLIGTTTVAAYEALVSSQYYVSTLLPQAKTIIVIGNGGAYFWKGFRAYCDAHPNHLEEREHPLDDYTSMSIEAVLTPHLQMAHATYRYLYPFRFWTEPVSFMHLARAAGIAGPSILGVVIHPHYGPWLALRAALLIDQEVSIAPQAPDFDPCPTCQERTCIQSCPANAIPSVTGWDIPGCVQHRIQVASDCLDYCHARYDCVYGREYRYPLDELQYHQRQSFTEMKKYFARSSTKSNEH